MCHILYVVLHAFEVYYLLNCTEANAVMFPVDVSVYSSTFCAHSKLRDSFPPPAIRVSLHMFATSFLPLAFARLFWFVYRIFEKYTYSSRVFRILPRRLGDPNGIPSSIVRCWHASLGFLILVTADGCACMK